MPDSAALSVARVASIRNQPAHRVRDVRPHRLDEGGDLLVLADRLPLPGLSHGRLPVFERTLLEAEALPERGLVTGEQVQTLDAALAGLSDSSPRKQIAKALPPHRRVHDDAPDHTRRAINFQTCAAENSTVSVQNPERLQELGDLKGRQPLRREQLLDLRDVLRPREAQGRLAHPIARRILMRSSVGGCVSKRLFRKLSCYPSGFSM